MKVIDYSFYVKMNELKNRLESTLNNLNNQVKDTTSIYDIQYAGSIAWIEIDSITNSEVPTYKDIYISVEKKSDGNIVTKYYDENLDEPIAIDFHDSNGIVATKKSIAYSLMNTGNGNDFSSQFKDVQNREKLSLNDLEHNLDVLSKETKMSKNQIITIIKEKFKELDDISDVTHISKEEIKSISEINNIKKDKDDKIVLNEQNKSPLNNNKSHKSEKDNPNIKQETDLTQKINNKFTLGDVLGVPEGGKLVVVYSSAVKDNTSTTRFTFLIKNKDGQFKPCKNLELVGGANPSNDVYVSNYDGSNVEKSYANSEYRVKSPHSNEGFVLTAKTGTYGTVDLGIGQAPRLQGLNNSDTNLVTTPLKTTSTYNTKPETKETLLSYNAGRYAADERNKEAQTHEKDNCKLTQKNVDGKKDTGHQHYQDSIQAEEITNYIERKLQDLYTKKGYKEYYEETFKSKFFETYLKGNFYPSREEFDQACNNYMNEHPFTRENGHEIRSKY